MSQKEKKKKNEWPLQGFPIGVNKTYKNAVFLILMWRVEIDWLY